MFGFGARRAFGPWLAAALVLEAPPLPVEDAVTAVHADTLRFTLHAPSRVRAGHPVPIALRLTNPGAHPVELHLLGREIAFDIVVAREDGALVWRRLARAVVPGILQVKILAPGETLELKDVWRQRSDAGEPIGPGLYTVQGILPTDEREPLRTPTARLRITGT